MNLKYALTAISLACLIMSTPLLVQAASPPKSNQPDDIYQILSLLARKYITDARLPDGSHVPAETSEELAKPLLPREVIIATVDHGLHSDIREVCGEDWEKDFYRFMDAERAKKIWSNKQIAYIGFLHGTSMGYFEKPTRQKGCSAELKRPNIKASDIAD